ncbi:unnamed protein product [Lactuca virosa]|uniref:DUF4283 domain-containing protein n=1 Tax=Lactuca virosa TaxID=75947 RepID=A0AAU9MTL8_9ASTR|nr:unnamed protein product [Lactuca virosa]
MLNPLTELGNWLNSIFLIGDAHSIDHMENLPSSLLLYEKTRYLGGLRLTLEFDSLKKAIEFLEDQSRWSDWFKWLITADKYEFQYKRVAWLKIIGLPHKLWGEDNFSTIVSNYGRVISPFSDIRNRRDYSMGKVGVLTLEKKWINDQTTACANDEIFSIGVVEYTDDWSPFHLVPYEKVDDESDKEDEEGDETEVEEDDDADEGISDTWLGGQNQIEDMKEGEITPESNSSGNGLGGNVFPIGKSTVVGNVMVSPKFVGNDAEINVEGSPKTIAILENNSGELADNEQLIPHPIFKFDAKQDIPTDSERSKFGSISKLVPLGCFGPFPKSQPNIFYHHDQSLEPH